MSRFIWESIDHSKDSKGHGSQSEAETVEEWESLTLRVMYSCSRIWELVKSVLCDDSPEGHLPEELEELDFGTKDVLSYSFRAVHESRYNLSVGSQFIICHTDHLRVT